MRIKKTIVTVMITIMTIIREKEIIATKDLRLS